MRTNAILNLVYNRKKVKLDPEDTALIQLEIIFVDQSKMYISSGIYLHPDQWDKKHKLVINLPTAGAINKKLADLTGKLRTVELRLNEQEAHLTRRDVMECLEEPGMRKNSFVAFMVAEIAKRKEIHVATRYRHNLITEELKGLNIINFSDLTLRNIQRYDDYLKEKKLEQTTVFKKHSNLKTYIHKAIDLELMKHEQNPYLKFEVVRGKHKIRTRLDDKEMKAIIKKVIKDPELAFCRDMYVFQMFTGISYRDMTFTGRQLKNNSGELWIEGLRKKNGEYYSVFLLPEAVKILKKHGTHLSAGQVFAILPQFEQNRKLKIIAGLCGIEKNITTHTARHTAASWMIRKGVPITVIRDILGHTKLDTTLIYAKLDNKTIMEEMQKADKQRK